MTSIHRITPDMLEEEFLRTHVYPDLEHEFYWDDSWDPAFYVSLARAGFIAVAYPHADQMLLLPQIQASYAVLDWEDVHVSRNLRRFLRSGRLVEDQIELRVAASVERVLGGLSAYHEDNWVVEPYEQLVRALPADGDARFAIHGIELWSRRLDRLIAGELGYTIGRTYTSLTGFCSPRESEFRHFGTLQMVLLAEILRDHGYAFWNLGHPKFAYKTALGARVLGRKAFLERWLTARDERPVQSLGVASGVTFRNGRHSSP